MIKISIHGSDPHPRFSKIVALSKTERKLLKMKYRTTPTNDGMIDHFFTDTTNDLLVPQLGPGALQKMALGSNKICNAVKFLNGLTKTQKKFLKTRKRKEKHRIIDNILNPADQKNVTDFFLTPERSVPMGPGQRSSATT
jgi:uncharacterized protein (DUF111 family)